MDRMSNFSTVELRCLNRSLSILNNCALTPREYQEIEKLTTEIGIELKVRE